MRVEEWGFDRLELLVLVEALDRAYGPGSKPEIRRKLRRAIQEQQFIAEQTAIAETLAVEHAEELGFRKVS